MPKSAKTPQEATARDPYRPRKCLLCGLTFVPKQARSRKVADDAKFCCDNHRKEFWRYGKMPWAKLMIRVEKEVVKIVDARVKELIAAYERRRAEAGEPPRAA